MATTSEIPRRASLETGMFVRMRAWLFGYDVFISYRHLDGLGYAMALQNRLKALDFAVFRDVQELPAGQRLEEPIRDSLRRSRVLVVVASPGARAEQSWVAREIAMFPPARSIIAIHFDDDAKEWPPLVAIRRKWLAEDGAALTRAFPSDHVVTEIAAARSFWRANRLGRLTVAVALIAVIALTGGTAYQTARGRTLEAVRAAQERALLAMSGASINARMAETQRANDEWVGRARLQETALASLDRQVPNLPTSALASLALANEAATALGAVTGGNVGPAYKLLRDELSLIGGFPSTCAADPGVAAIAIGGPDLIAASKGGPVVDECFEKEKRTLHAPAVVRALAYSDKPANRPALRGALEDGRVIEWSNQNTPRDMCKPDKPMSVLSSRFSNGADLLLIETRPDQLQVLRVDDRCSVQFSLSHPGSQLESMVSDDGIVCAVFSDAERGRYAVCGLTGQTRYIPLPKSGSVIGVACMGERTCDLVVSQPCDEANEDPPRTCASLVEVTTTDATSMPVPPDWKVAVGGLMRGSAAIEPVNLRGGTVATGGDQLMIGDDDGSLRRWSRDEPTLANARRYGHERSIAALTRKGDNFLTMDDSGALRRWPNEEEDVVLHTGALAVKCARFDSNGHWIGVVADDVGARTWFASTERGGAEVSTHCHEHLPGVIDQPSDEESAVRATIKGRALEVVIESHTLELYGPQAQIWSRAVSPDAKLVAASTTDGMVAVWELPRGGPPLLMRVNDDRGTYFVAFSPDSKAIVASGVDGTSVYRVVEPQALRDLATRRQRALTADERLLYTQ